MRKTIFIIDPVCPKYYDLDVLENEGMGASESYLLYNLLSLINNPFVDNYQFIFFQDTREKKLEYEGKNNNILIFEPLNMILEYETMDPETILLQRDPKLLHYLYKIYPNANLILYCHDFFEGGNLQTLKKDELKKIIDTGVKFLCVSKWHMLNLTENFDLRKLYNINIDYNYFHYHDKIIKGKRDPYKLGYFSAHHKGLGKALTIFKKLKEINNKYKLVIASPKYSDYEIEEIDGVELKYNLPRTEVLKEISTSLCLLHPNKEYPETFGCVNMEANALGIPVLCYKYGATAEIIKDERQFINSNEFLYDPNDLLSCVQKIAKWSKDMPEITISICGLNEDKVMNKWLKILNIIS